jgi:chromosome segregation ATPase
MSDTSDLRLLGKMVARMQSTVEDLRQEYASIRASLDSLNSNFLSRNAEFNVRMSGLELAQMKLAANMDAAHTKIDRIELVVESLKEEQTATADRLGGITSRLDDLTNRMDSMTSRQESMDAKLDLILSRLGER